MWPKFDDEKTGTNLAMIGSVNDEIIQLQELACEMILVMKELYNEQLVRYLGFDTDAKPHEILERYAVKRGCIAKGETPDTERAAILLMDDFRAGKLGRITLEMA